MKLNLRFVKVGKQWLAQELFDNGDVTGFVYIASWGTWLEHVHANKHPLIQKGIYEKALTIAFCREATTTHWAWDVSELEDLFRRGNRDKFLKASDPFYAHFPLLAFRGVAGKGASRHVKGLAWTLDLDTACAYAMKGGYKDPAVYSALIEPADFILYFNLDVKQEAIICMPASCTRLDMSLDEMREGEARAKQKEDERLRALTALNKSGGQVYHDNPPRFLISPSGSTVISGSTANRSPAIGKPLLFCRSHCGCDAQRDNPLVRQQIGSGSLRLCRDNSLHQKEWRHV